MVEFPSTLALSSEIKEREERRFKSGFITKEKA
jgi:hypothetical protein